MTPLLIAIYLYAGVTCAYLLDWVGRENRWPGLFFSDWLILSIVWPFIMPVLLLVRDMKE